jgi:hypothetical protein
MEAVLVDSHGWGFCTKINKELIYLSIYPEIDKIDKIVGFHDATRHATLRNSAMLSYLYLSR